MSLSELKQQTRVREIEQFRKDTARFLMEQGLFDTEQIIEKTTKLEQFVFNQTSAETQQNTDPLGICNSQKSKPHQEDILHNIELLGRQLGELAPLIGLIGYQVEKQLRSQAKN